MMQEMMMTKKTMMLDAGDVALSLTRRQLFGGAGALALAAALPGAALAQGQAEWRQSYDAGSVRSLKTRSNYPMLGPDSVIATEQASSNIVSLPPRAAGSRCASMSACGSARAGRRLWRCASGSPSQVTLIRPLAARPRSTRMSRRACAISRTGMA